MVVMNSMSTPGSSMKRAHEEVLKLVGKLARTQKAALAVTIRLLNRGSDLSETAVSLCIQTWRSQSLEERPSKNSGAEAMHQWRRSAMRHAGVELIFQICRRRETRKRALNLSKVVYLWRLQRWHEATKHTFIEFIGHNRVLVEPPAIEEAEEVILSRPCSSLESIHSPSKAVVEFFRSPDDVLMMS